jgi:hypothetical protein
MNGIDTGGGDGLKNVKIIRPGWYAHYEPHPHL